MPLVIRRCECCHFPLAGKGVPVCRQCVMIAKGETYADGSDPADGLSLGEIAYIGMRVRSICHANAA